jgi:hypothetical protein
LLSSAPRFLDVEKEARRIFAAARIVLFSESKVGHSTGTILQAQDERRLCIKSGGLWTKLQVPR